MLQENKSALMCQLMKLLRILMSRKHARNEKWFWWRLIMYVVNAWVYLCQPLYAQPCGTSYQYWLSSPLFHFIVLSCGSYLMVAQRTISICNPYQLLYFHCVVFHQSIYSWTWVLHGIGHVCSNNFIINELSHAWRTFIINRHIVVYCVSIVLSMDL